MICDNNIQYVYTIWVHNKRACKIFYLVTLLTSKMNFSTVYCYTKIIANYQTGSLYFQLFVLVNWFLGLILYYIFFNDNYLWTCSEH